MTIFDFRIGGALADVARRTAIVVPTHFEPEVPAETIRTILEGTFQDQDVYCPRNRNLIVVDQDSIAERVLGEAGPDSPLYGIPLHVLPRNRAKAGAVEAGLRQLLEEVEAEYYVTRDCDGDHRLEDLPRLFSMAAFLEQATGSDVVCAMGARPSLEKPMGWVREQWEDLTNDVLLDLLAFVQAGRERVLDRRFWWGRPDIQSGYRIYSRKAAELVVQSLGRVSEDQAVRALACEFVTFADLVLQEAAIGQVQRFTLVEQPVSSYSKTDFAETYGSMLRFVAEHLGVDSAIALRFFDNRMLETSLFFTDARSQLLRCRELLTPSPGPVVLPPFL